MTLTTLSPSRKYSLVCLLTLALAFPAISKAGEAIADFSRLHKAGLIVLDANGRAVVADRADTPLIPASTTKLATAWMALKHWGEQYRFSTTFYLDKATQILWVKGSGDPYLVSEELELIARSLAQKGLKQIKGIGLDTSLFQTGLVLPGTGTTDNPYDAVPTAVAANFNTVDVRKVGGQITSAEPHTPLTPYAASMADTFRGGELRVNTGPNPHNAERYFAELLAAFLRQQGVAVGNEIVSGQISHQTAYYTHVNSKPLAEVIRAMLKFSTNFVANQLILKLSAEHFQRPANAADVQRYMEETISGHFHWSDFSLADGAGLSRQNRLSPKQLTELLQAFRNWKHLLPEVEPGVYAKTGTLTGVSALAGYITSHGAWQPFAVVMNENVPFNLRHRIARELAGR